ncbi:family 78 glycoside hydrolase catalytic domain, partial [bacterium]|nr:family 78 glycoside hydrolase catalytic domain [bacterium]
VCYVGNVPDTRGGLIAELVDGNDVTIAATDADWKTARATAWRADTHMYGGNQVTPYQEFYDVRQAIEGWDLPGFDDDRWDDTVPVPGSQGPRPGVWPPRPGYAMPWARLIPRDIPHMVETDIYADRIDTVEECVEITNRDRGEDLSICLSAHGTPLKYARVDDEEKLLSPGGATVVQCSTNHLDRVFDGIHDPCIVLDFGRVITAFVEIDIEGADGDIVDFGYVERLVDGRFNNTLECQFSDRVTLKDGRQTYRPFTWKGFRYLKLRFWSCLKPVRIHSVKAVETAYPFEERGKFESSDARLNRVWEISRATLKLCSTEQLMDTPWREQAQWLGDVAAVTVGGVYACYGDPRLPSKFFRQAAANQFPTGLLSNVSNRCSSGWMHCIPDYSLEYVLGLWNHYLYTGEERWIHRFFPHVLKVVQNFLDQRDEHGLVNDMPCWVLIDWAHTDKRGECAALNALLYGALEALAKMAAMREDGHSAALAIDARRAIAASFVPRFFDAERGCFADANVDGELSEMTSEHANVAAIAFGLCDDDLAATVVRTLYEDKSIDYAEAQPFFTTFALQALDRVGRFDLALEIIDERWGKRMVDRGATSTFEEWGENGSWRDGYFKGILRSHSHAWSACPAEFLIKNLIGLEILEPGCGKVKLAPQDVPFDYEAAYPTPLGVITVKKQGDDTQVDAPEGIELA